MSPARSRESAVNLQKPSTGDGNTHMASNGGVEASRMLIESAPLDLGRPIGRFQP